MDMWGMQYLFIWNCWGSRDSWKTVCCREELGHKMDVWCVQILFIWNAWGSRGSWKTVLCPTLAQRLNRGKPDFHRCLRISCLSNTAPQAPLVVSLIWKSLALRSHCAMKYLHLLFVLVQTTAHPSSCVKSCTQIGWKISRRWHYTIQGVTLISVLRY